MNSGKKFEELIKLSAKEQSWDFNRLKDAGGWGKADNTRFTIRNICDFTLFKDGLLFYIEAKSRKSRLAFKDLTQHKALLKKSSEGNVGVYCGYLVELDGDWHYLSVHTMDGLINNIGKKSVNASDLHKYKIGSIIPPRKKKARIYLYDIINSDVV